MKKAILIAAAALALGSAGGALADPPHGKGHPPGLAKKAHGMPPGQAKKMWREGQRLPRTYYAEPRYYIADPVRYDLRPAPAGYRWVLVEEHAYLVRRDNGLIADVVGGLVASLLR